MSVCSTGRVRRYAERQRSGGREPTCIYLHGDAKRVLHSFPRPFSHGVVIERLLLNLADDQETMRRVFPEVSKLAELEITEAGE